MRSGVVVAGGRSTRFGGADKAVADLAGTPMVRRVVDRVAPVVDDLVVNCRAEQVDAIDAALSGVEPAPAVATDPEPDRGPLAGIAAGLRAAEGEYAFVVACDMPFVDPDLARFLFDRAAGHDAAVPRPAEWYQTTQAVYRSGAMADACEAALADGEGRVLEAVEAVDAVTVGAAAVERHADPDTFVNVNTPAELAAAADRLG